MQIPGPHPGPTESETLGVRFSNVVLTSSQVILRHVKVLLWHQNHQNNPQDKSERQLPRVSPPGHVQG